MAIALDANLGTSSVQTGTAANITTTATAAAGTLIVIWVSWFSAAGATSSVTVGGSSATRDKHVANGSDFFDIYSFQSTAGLATSSTIGVSFSTTSGAMLAGAASFTGIVSSGALVTTSNSNTTGANWSSGSATNTGFPDALYCGGTGTEDTTSPTTSTATSGIELHDVYNTAGQQGMATGYLIVSSVGSNAVTGTLSNSASTANTGALAVYAGVSAGSVGQAFAPHRMPQGV